ncbi:MAG: AMP-binding protein [Burkholderiales bacterium]
MNVAQWLERSARAFGDRPALASGTQRCATYAEFRARAGRLADGMRRMGARPGDRIALYAANHPGYLEAMWAAWIAGLVAVPVNAKLHPREAAYILEHCGSVACWVDEEREGMAPGGCRQWRLDAIDALLGPDVAAIEPRAPSDLAWLFYTSGTTGRPKGVMLSHGNLVQMTLAYLAEVMPVEPGDALLHAAPLSHGSGLYNFAYVARGGLNVLPASRGFDAHEVLDLAQAYPGLAMFAAPTIVMRIVAACRERPGACESIGRIVYGGGPMYLADIEEAVRVMGPRFAQIYGQGESPMTITVLPQHVIADLGHPRRRERLQSVGYAQANVEVAIRDEAGRDLLRGEIGEICVRGPTVMQGYWNNPEASASTLAGGWLHTGDLGCLDEDGFLTLKDRSKDLIISGGSNIYPREVEEVLLAHPCVREASVVGMPDPEWGEVVVAFVVADGVAAEELDALCLASIARFKRPKHYRFVGELPKNNYGKVLKTELRKRLDAPGG